METEKTAKETSDFAYLLGVLGADQAHVGIMMPLPGTEVEEMALKEEGGYKLVSTDWKDYGNKYIGNNLEFKYVSKEYLQRIQLITFLRFYFIGPRQLIGLLKAIKITTIPVYLLNFIFCIFLKKRK